MGATSRRVIATVTLERTTTGSPFNCCHFYWWFPVTAFQDKYLTRVHLVRLAPGRISPPLGCSHHCRLCEISIWASFWAAFHWHCHQGRGLNHSRPSTNACQEDMDFFYQLLYFPAPFSAHLWKPSRNLLQKSFLRLPDPWTRCFCCHGKEQIISQYGCSHKSTVSTMHKSFKLESCVIIPFSATTVWHVSEFFRKFIRFSDFGRP